MRRTIKSLLLWGVCVPSLMVSFMNCSQLVALDSSPGEFAAIHSSVDEQNFSVQSAEQLARSMASVTGVTYVDSIVNEYNSRKALMTTDYSIESVNAPMMVSIANLGSQYCNELVRSESSVKSGERMHFKTIDFSKGVSAVDATSFDKVLKSLSQKFWGREPSADERNIFIESKQEFIRAIPVNNVNSTAQTRSLMLMTCTSMLASLEFILI